MFFELPSDIIIIIMCFISLVISFFCIILFSPSFYDKAKRFFTSENFKSRYKELKIGNFLFLLRFWLR